MVSLAAIIPEWNDSFVAKLTSNKFTTVDDFEKELKTEIQAQNEYSLKKTYSSGLWSKILDSSKINGYPEDKLKSAADDYFSKYQEQYKKYAEKYSKTYEEILTAYGFKSEDELKAACEEQAKKELEYIMLACEISKKENIAVTEEINFFLFFVKGSYNSGSCKIFSGYLKNIVKSALYPLKKRD